MVVEPPRAANGGEAAELRASARGWQGMQLAVLGFIGLCGVLTDPDPSTPRSIQVLAGLLALAALATACLATYLVGRAAWPLDAAADARDVRAVEHARRSLTTGVRLTFVAVALLALSAAAGWWPSEDPATASAATVQAQAQGRVFCGTLAEGSADAVRIEAGGQPVEIPLSALDALRPVDGCP